MSNPIKQLTKLTARAKELGGVSFGGKAADPLLVAGALGMPDPDTGEKLDNNAYIVGRYFYCDDQSHRYKVRRILLGHVRRTIATGKVKETTVLKLVNQAVREFKNPYTKIDKNGEQNAISPSRYRIAKDIGIAPNNYTRTHDAIYKEAVRELHMLANSVVSHLYSTLD